MKENKALLLISGGFDSPVAGHLLKNEGFEIYSLHFSQEPFVDKSHELKAKELSEMLGFRDFISINIGQELLEISETAKHSYYFILMKRLMYRIATKLAEQLDCSFIVTGESLAQVSSQTLTNLITLEESITNIPIIRPLISYTKNEIINIAKDIGTYEISKSPESCDRLGPKYPIINSDINHAIDQENKIKNPTIEEMVNNLV